MPTIVFSKLEEMNGRMFGGQLSGGFCAFTLMTTGLTEGQKNDLEYLSGITAGDDEDERRDCGRTTANNGEEEVEVCPPGILKLYMREGRVGRAADRPTDLKWEFRSAPGQHMQPSTNSAFLQGKSSG